MLRTTFLLAGLIAILNLYLTEIFVVQILSAICIILSLAITGVWPEPLPPPPPLDLWSEAPEGKNEKVPIQHY